jgi:hypothetical protein
MATIARGAMKPNLRAVNIKAIKRELPKPPGMVPFTDLGDVRTFGLPLTRESYINPAAHDMLKEVRGAESDGTATLPGAMFGALGKVNQLAAQTQVALAPYHLLVNLRANVASALRTPADYARFVRGAMSKKAIAEAQEAGAFRPYARREGGADWTRPLADLTPAERRARIMETPHRAWESASALPLYKWAEPAIAGGLHAALKGRLGSAGAALETRSVLGEPENLPREMRQVGQLAEFPNWFLSQMLRWTGKLATQPSTYNAPHAMIEHFNESRGRSRQPGDANRFLPPIMLGTNAKGERVVLEVPHPGDRPLRFYNALAKWGAGSGTGTDVALAVSGGANPTINPVVHGILMNQKRQEGVSDWAHDLEVAKPPADDPSGPGWANFVKRITEAGKGVVSWAGAYSPIPGVGGQSYVHTEAPPAVQAKNTALRNKIVGWYLYNRNSAIIRARSAADKAKRAGDMDAYRKATLYANKQYAEMLKELTKHGLPPDPSAGSDNPAPWSTLQHMTKPPR